MEYVHLAGNEDWGYCLREEILEFNERKILYLLSELKDEHFKIMGEFDMVMEVSKQAMRTVYVKGYIVRWKYAKDEKGLDVSELEPLDSKEQEVIKQLLESTCDARTVCFG
jgi:hypothetical protein